VISWPVFNTFVAFTEPLPRKGMETIQLVNPAFFMCLYRTTSPQGDGNNFHFRHSGFHQNFTEPLPRKGMETLVTQVFLDLQFLFTEPLPRKGMETM